MHEKVPFLLHVLPNILGLLLNAILYVLARYHSPQTIRIYSLLILNFAVCDFFACLTSLIVCQRIIPGGTSLFYISEGLCQYIGPRFCYVSYSIMLHMLSHSFYSIVLSFSFRYYVVVHKTPSINKIKLIIFLIYLPSFLQMVSFSFADDPPEVIVPLLRSKYPQYNLTGRTVTGNLNIFEWKALATILYMTIPVAPVYICVLALRRGIVRHLNDSIMSSRTRNLHQQLLTALIWQAMLPLFYLLAVISYACGQLGIYNHPLLEHSTFILAGFVPALSPITSLYFVRHYRDRLRYAFIKRSSILREAHSKEFSTVRDSQTHRTSHTV
ncbi:unnamed protein product [Haemonchus placei]|uniref:G_PROTEIN_RECEP_F1_2 domain-containing protein n=1 Tax=Haemonchus placei TaxID=6290 RepID=A0A0N4WH89_HAEPC|nr:unnamed protein product [Haemonchus placei]